MYIMNIHMHARTQTDRQTHVTNKHVLMCIQKHYAYHALKYMCTVLVTSNFLYFADLPYRRSANSCAARYKHSQILQRTFSGGCARSHQLALEDPQIHQVDSTESPRITQTAKNNHPINLKFFVRTYQYAGFSWIQQTGASNL